MLQPALGLGVEPHSSIHSCCALIVLAACPCCSRLLTWTGRISLSKLLLYGRHNSALLEEGAVARAVVACRPSMWLQWLGCVPHDTAESTGIARSTYSSKVKGEAAALLRDLAAWGPGEQQSSCSRKEGSLLRPAAQQCADSQLTTASAAPQTIEVAARFVNIGNPCGNQLFLSTTWLAVSVLVGH
jgi:hypothetical protein